MKRAEVQYSGAFPPVDLKLSYIIRIRSNGLNSMLSHGELHFRSSLGPGSVRRDGGQCHRDDNAPHLRSLFMHTLV